MNLRLLFAVVTVAALSFAPARAEKAETFVQAKALSVQTGKPVLLEFNHDDCIHCQQAIRDFDSLPNLIQELDKVILLRLAVLQSEGAALAPTYQVGTSFPLFVLTDSAGRVFTRWTGYTGAERFLTSLNQSLTERITVDERVVKSQNAPSPIDVSVLANYFSDTREYTRALAYCRELQSLQKDVNLDFRIFKVAAEAVWSGMLPFDSIVTTAEAMLANPDGNKYYYGEMAQIIANVARKIGQTDHIAKYLMAGIDATASNKNKAGVDLHRDLIADYALHSHNDTTESLRVKKLALGDGWETDPARCFRFGEWCLRRKINLVEAERLVRMATDKATGDQPRAAHLRVLAEICYVRGNATEAIRLANEALSLDPSAVWFENKLAEWRAGK